MYIVKIIKEKQGTIVDVRSPEEFRTDHVKGSVNIPWPECVQRLDQMKSLQEPLVLCCATGIRSGQVYRYLSQEGIHCYNGGAWTEINYYLTDEINRDQFLK